MRIRSKSLERCEIGVQVQAQSVFLAPRLPKWEKGVPKSPQTSPSFPQTLPKFSPIRVITLLHEFARWLLVDRLRWLAGWLRIGLRIVWLGWLSWLAGWLDGSQARWLADWLGMVRGGLKWGQAGSGQKVMDL